MQRGQPVKVRKNNLFIKLLLSFVIVTVIPIVFSFITYFLTSGLIRTEITRANYVLLSQVQTEIDSRIYDIYRLFDQIALNPDVRSVTAAKEVGREPRRFLMHRIGSDLNRLVFINSFVDNIFIYYRNQDATLTRDGYMSIDLFHSLNIGVGQVDELRNLLNMRHVHTNSLVVTQKGSYIYFMNTIIFPVMVESSATIVIAVNADTIGTFTRNILLDHENIVVIANEHGSVITSTSCTYAIGTGRGYVNITTVSGLVDWAYSIYIPTHLFYEGARRIQLYTIIGLLASVIICGAAIYLLAGTNYKPIEKIMDEYSKTQISLLKKERQFTNHTLGRVLKGDMSDEDIEALQSLNLLGQFYSVVLFLVNKSAFSAELSQFIVSNIFLELASVHFAVQACTVDNEGVIILSYTENKNEFQLKTKEIANTVMHHIKEHFDMDITVALGGMHQGHGNIQLSFMEAQEAAEYRNILGECEVIHYLDISNSHKWYYYPIDEEQKIYNALKAGNTKSVIGLIEGIFEINFAEKEHIPAITSKYVVSEIFNTVIKALDGERDMEMRNEIEQLQAIESDSIEVVEHEVIDVITQVCEHIKSGFTPQNRNSDLSKGIVEYINKQYTDSNLSVRSIGAEFNLTPAYMSKLFKEQTGEGLLNYINNTRISAAKILLQDGKSVNEAAEMVGFINAGAMIRVFKKVTGITPGQIKNM
ncbi:MAG: AraC family transcriptional regulator [Defluviitaleaceae bacterium]|nr:AraC family transcriptional regulator [Defluviitaleaceae bacterium]